MAQTGKALTPPRQKRTKQRNRQNSHPQEKGLQIVTVNAQSCHLNSTFTSPQLPRTQGDPTRGQEQDGGVSPKPGDPGMLAVLWPLLACLDSFLGLLQAAEESLPLDPY